MLNKKHRIGVMFAIVIAAAVVLATGCTFFEDKEFSGSASGNKTAKNEITVSIYDRGIIPASEGSYADNRWTNWINRNGPVNVKFIPIMRSESRQNLMKLFASGSAPDIINEYNTAIRNSLYEQNQLLPLDNVLKFMPEYEKLITQYPQLKNAGTKSDGKLYEIGKLNEANPLHAFFIRTDWLKKLGLEVPKTQEEFFQVAKAFTELDPDGDGKDDTYGTNLSYYSENALNEMFGDSSSITQFSWGIKDGKIVRLWENELASLTFKKSLYDNHIIDKNYMYDSSGSKAKQDFLNGKIGIYINPSVNWTEFTLSDLAILKKNVPGAEIAPLAYPKTSMGEFTGAINNPIQMTTVINANTKNPEAAAQYIDFMMKPKTSVTFLGDEGVHWTKNPNGCPSVLDPYKQKYEVSYNVDYQMFVTGINQKCGYIINKFNPEVPEQKTALDIYKSAQKLYLDPSRQSRLDGGRIYACISEQSECDTNGSAQGNKRSLCQSDHQRQ
ncbi:extracellular solute-binding protein [Paenibacillus filicis]|uniref:Extracellular solute-binding protein n=1 Tax=Paenibacillus gyeongsangnamensis TaxID=3388067 RepID=A0ABT4QHV2_9BACL|nr:extracellular solute-binding protein [Paenibacillus filicis]MCZ8516438.1 extracellular solute-binding protein [Paenibacillus filicis]